MMLIDIYIVVAKVRDKMSLSKRTVPELNIGRFRLKEQKDLKLTKRYKIKYSNRSTALKT